MKFSPPIPPCSNENFCFHVGDYSFGFNGKDKESEFNSGAYDFGARIHDARLGRWMSVDPLTTKFPGISSFQFSLDSPIAFNDEDGNEGRLTIVDNENEHTITMETTVFLVGKDAELYKDQVNFTTKTVKVQDRDIEGKIWDVQIKVTYKYSPELNAKLESEGLEDGKYLDQVGYNADYKKDELAVFGFERGDNLMQVDNSLPARMGKEAGGTGQGSWIGYVRIANPDAVTDVINHEVAHELGYDERYNDIYIWHPGWESDYMGQYVDMIAERTFDDKHYVDLMDFALKNGTLNGTKTFNSFDRKSKLIVDDTDHGTDIAGEEEVEQLENCVEE